MLLTRLFFVFGFVFSFSFSLPDHLNVTTFLGAIIRSFPVAGFLLFRFFLFFTQNLPKPEIITSSPDSSSDLMSSSKVSTVSIDFLRVKPFCSITASAMWALVRVPGLVLRLCPDPYLTCHLAMNIY